MLSMALSEYSRIGFVASWPLLLHVFEIITLVSLLFEPSLSIHILL